MPLPISDYGAVQHKTAPEAQNERRIDGGGLALSLGPARGTQFANSEENPRCFGPMMPAW
jgi:hypothetical protein